MRRYREGLIKQLNDTISVQRTKRLRCLSLENEKTDICYKTVFYKILKVKGKLTVQTLTNPAKLQAGGIGRAHV